MVMRESTCSGGGAIRGTIATSIIVGRDPEIVVSRPPDIPALLMSFFNISKGIPKYLQDIFRHSLGLRQLTRKPSSRKASSSDHFAPAFASPSISPAGHGHRHQRVLCRPAFVLLPNIYGAWLMPIYGYTQHAGLAENVLGSPPQLPHGVCAKPIHRFLYSFNHHVEHHMFLLVPYHALLHCMRSSKTTCLGSQQPVGGLERNHPRKAQRQTMTRAHYVKRQLPAPKPVQSDASALMRPMVAPMPKVWIEVCSAEHYAMKTLFVSISAKRNLCPIARADGQYFATDGICTTATRTWLMAWSKR